ncbi:MAG: anthranilate synthase component I [bacterium]|nr:anthranilate synthase component I [bacterium]
MYHPNRNEFKKKAGQGNLIPVYTEILADMETPVSAFYKIARNDFSYLLESVEGGERVGRHSFLGISPKIILESKGPDITITRKEQSLVTKEKGDPLVFLKKLLEPLKPVAVDGLPGFYGGWVGYLAYDYVRFIEDIPDNNPDDLSLPDSIFMIANDLLIFDHVLHTLKVVSLAQIKPDQDADETYNETITRIEEIVSALRAPRELPSELKGTGRKAIKPESNFTKSAYESAVMTAKEYIRAGDIFQVVPSQRLSTPILSSPLDIYRALRVINPSPYMYYLNFGPLKIVGSSPEILVRVTGRDAEVRPIAGTRPRGKSRKEDKELEKDLLSDPKELAEHVMLVDLGRNDLGRVCEYESIHWPEFEVIERYSHVMHIVSSVKGKLRPGFDSLDVLRACFPAGTVSGAPKIRAMEIIDELESTRRGPYAGSVGYYSFSGNLDMAITIRTIVISGDKAYVQAGGGVVADSDPEREYQESMNKARGMIKAIELAEGGFR